ncbi:DUF3850 domain-containing protein [Candidatus Woesearchaeota archaeon]|jgi:hypothetical protein|nr:DUF3850 domain-containing protein [Candidatus Woesearchaeota archaeon]MBT6518663.1 DUF3850 domain-containing protein [Candidatus Woesearchaeota archaeon]MBT7368853.1 DUF3850 domain-containing protein [Candidatus Woesearchaeota archaeon]
MNRIEKKVHPQYFQKIHEGKKNFELRLGDWHCQEGDYLVLREWCPKKQDYTGRVLEKEIKYVAKFKLDELFWHRDDIEEHGIQIISLKD